MHRVLAVDASPLILLGKISRLDLLLTISNRVVVPEVVLGELEAAEARDRLGLVVGSLVGFSVEPSRAIPEEVARWKLGAGEAAVVSHCLGPSGLPCGAGRRTRTPLRSRVGCTADRYSRSGGCGQESRSGR